MNPSPPLQPPQRLPSSTHPDNMTTHSCSSLPDPQPTKMTTTASPRSSSPLHAQTSHAPSSAPTKPRGSVARQKRNSWMRSSVVRRAAAVVDEEVAALCEKSPFLNSLDNGTHPEIALFHRMEVQLGKALGRGGFAEVYTVAQLDVEEDPDDTDPRSQRRRQCQAKLLTSTSGRPAYAIKFLRKKLLSNTREFQHAAIDLAVESKYLAALSHRNIIKIRGLTAGGTSAFRTGKHDDYFILMDHLQETLERRMLRWQQRDNSSPSQYFARTLDYSHQIADALAYLHDKAIVYRDLKPQNLGFRERDTIQLFDFGLCRELPKPKGQCQRAENLEDEETFHMSGVGTQRYMAPEILNTRQYNLKADVYSWSMVALEMMTWKKPFSEYTPEEHTKYVAGLGQRPKLVLSSQDEAPIESPAEKQTATVHVDDWPCGVAELLQEAWTQDVVGRLTMQSVLEQAGNILAKLNGEEDEAEEKVSPIQDDGSSRREHNDETEVVLEFPSHFSPRHPLRQHREPNNNKPQQPLPVQITRDDSDAWFGDRQSDASTSYQELTMTSTSTTMHDSNSTSTGPAQIQ